MIFSSFFRAFFSGFTSENLDPKDPLNRGVRCRRVMEALQSDSIKEGNTALIIKMMLEPAKPTSEKEDELIYDCVNYDAEGGSEQSFSIRFHLDEGKLVRDGIEIRKIQG